MLASSRVLFTNVVVRAAPSHRTVEPLTKFAPFTVSAKPGRPGGTLPGRSEVSTGAGGLPTVKVAALETSPLAGLSTLTVRVPDVVTSEAGMDARSSPALTNVVVRATPFHRTTAA